MTTLEQRQTLLGLIEQACQDGARLHKACALIGLAARTVQRWLAAGQDALQLGDRRTPDQRIHNCPPNKLSDAEREVAMGVLNSDEYKDCPPARSCPAWPTRASTWQANPRCTDCCAKPGNWHTGALRAHPKSAANHAPWWPRSQTRSTAGESVKCAPICPPNCAARTSTCTCSWTYQPQGGGLAGL